MNEFKKVSDHYQAIKNDRKKLNSLLPLVEIFEKVKLLFWV
jgi:hypothetical protein